jgi:hypothetical protein
MTAKGDKTAALLYCAVGGGTIEAACCNVRAVAPDLAQRLVPKFGYVSRMRSTNAVNVGRGSFIPMPSTKRTSVQTRDARGGHFLTLKLAPRADTHARPFHTHSFHHCIDYLEREAYTILDRNAVFIRPLIGFWLQELIQEVAVSSVYLNTVEAGLHRISCRLCVQLNVLFDLGDGKFPWGH